ncbi:thromboxane A2 receptor-like [Ostrea edulis]|uniref:thromboxane A2 receptor-like n=1 Tax=Ostrea edulis TaxID=37623 RepID=UPI0024AED2FD|nr:thromboxane A2 receptor-like [Ostrea edulis]
MLYFQTQFHSRMNAGLVTTTTNTSNITIEPRIWESAVPPALQFVLGVAGNLIALIALVTSRKRHKWKPFYRLVAGLALTDGGGILLVYPTVMIRYASDFTYEFSKPLCHYSSFVFTFMLISSAMIVCAMSFDRFIAILYPFKYNFIGKKHRANLTLVVIWLLGTLISSLHLMGLGSSFKYYPGSWCFLNFNGISILDRVNSYIYSLFGLLILCTIFSFNILVIVSLCRNLRRDKIILKSHRRKSDIFNVCLLLVIVSVFTVCWTPLMFTILGHAALWISGNGSRELLVTCAHQTPNARFLGDIGNQSRMISVGDLQRSPQPRFCRLLPENGSMTETRYADAGTSNEKYYTFLWQGKSSDESREHGVDFAVKNNLLNMIESGRNGSGRLLTFRLNTAEGPITLVSAYAPTLSASSDTKDEFYENLASIISNTASTERRSIQYDFSRNMVYFMRKSISYSLILRLLRFGAEPS